MIGSARRTAAERRITPPPTVITGARGGTTVRRMATAAAGRRAGSAPIPHAGGTRGGWAVVAAGTAPGCRGAIGGSVGGARVLGRSWWARQLVISPSIWTLTTASIATPSGWSSTTTSNGSDGDDRTREHFGASVPNGTSMTSHVTLRMAILM